MSETRINNSKVRLLKGDLTALDVQAIAYYTTPDLKLGSGFGNAISMRGGPSVKRELEEVGSVEPCGAVVSGAGELKAQYIIHAAGPRFREPDMERKLKVTMLSALGAALAKGIEQVAFPPMGAGFYGIPLDTCARVMLEAVREHAASHELPRDVVICVMDNREYLPFEAEMAKYKTAGVER